MVAIWLWWTPVITSIRHNRHKSTENISNSPPITRVVAQMPQIDPQFANNFLKKWMLFASRHLRFVFNRLQSSQITRQWSEMVQNSSSMCRIYHKSSRIALFVSKSFQIRLSSGRIVSNSSQIMLMSPPLASRRRIGAIVCLNCTENNRHEAKGIPSSCPFHSVGAVNSYKSLTPRCLDLR